MSFTLGAVHVPGAQYQRSIYAPVNEENDQVPAVVNEHFHLK